MYGRANEVSAMFMDDADALEDRKLFVQNLGDLFSQTREQVAEMYLDDNEIVTIVYYGGTTKRVNVHLDSYAAIVRDVARWV